MLRPDDPRPELHRKLVETLAYVKEQLATVAAGMQFWNYWQLENFLECALMEREPTPFLAVDIVHAIQGCEVLSDRGIRWTPPQPRRPPPTASPQPIS